MSDLIPVKKTQFSKADDTKLMSNRGGDFVVAGCKRWRKKR
jgi:hypothetical protein